MTQDNRCGWALPQLLGWEWGLGVVEADCVRGALPRPFVGAAHSPSYGSPSGVEVRNWSPVSEAMERPGQPGQCGTWSAKSPDTCSPPRSLLCSRTFHGSHLPCDTYSQTQCRRGLARGGSRSPWTHSSPLQDEESRVTQHAACGWREGHWDPGEGWTGARVKEGEGGGGAKLMGPEGQVGTVRLALGAWLEWTQGQENDGFYLAMGGELAVSIWEQL